MTRTDLLALAERVEAGSGADPALRGQIKKALSCYSWEQECLTSSLDAVEALRERLLPIKHEITSRLTDGTWTATVSVPGYRTSYGDATATEPRARLAALLRAYAETVGG